MATSLEAIRAGAAKVGRTLPEDFHTACLSYACVLEPGESLASDRVIDEVGSMASATLHYWWEIYKKAGHDGFVRGDARPVWENYLDHVESTPEATRHQSVHDGHCTYLSPAERRFITPEIIRASGGLVGEPDEIIGRLRQMEAAGLREVTLLPPMASARKCFRDFAELVIAKY